MFNVFCMQLTFCERYTESGLCVWSNCSTAQSGAEGILKAQDAIVLLRNISLTLERQLFFSGPWTPPFRV